MTKTILLADQDEEFRRLMAEAFSDEPYRLVLAADFQEAMRAVDQHRPDLVLLDAGAGVDGFAVCRHLKDQESTRGIPIVLVCSGGEDEAQIVRAFTEGADDFLRKPLSVAYLKTKIRIWMARGESGR